MDVWIMLHLYMMLVHIREVLGSSPRTPIQWEQSVPKRFQPVYFGQNVASESVLAKKFNIVFPFGTILIQIGNEKGAQCIWLMIEQKGLLRR